MNSKKLFIFNKAICNLGYCLWKLKKLEKSFECYEKATNMQHPKGSLLFSRNIEILISKATSNLAYCYENAVGCQQDHQKAVELYEKAGKLGYLAGYN